LTATAGSGQISLNWNVVDGAASYNVYWADTPGVTTTSGTKVSNLANSWVHTGLFNGTTYYYIVTASNRLGEGTASAAVKSIPIPFPAAPTTIATTEPNTINFTTVVGASGYNLYWSAASTTPDEKIKTGTKIPNIIAPYTLIAPKEGTPYYYVLTSYNSLGESLPSIEYLLTTVPGSPTKVVVTPGNRQNAISWDVVTGATGYNIYWSTSTDVTTTNGIKIANVTTPHTHTGLTSGTTYSYIVTAYNNGGESKPSNTVSSYTVKTNREMEPNDTTGKATPLLIGSENGEMRGQLSSPGDTGDKDYFKFVSPGGIIDFTITPAANAAKATIHALDFTVISSVTLSGVTILSANTIAGGTYYLLIEKGTSTQDYSITSNLIQ